MKDSSISQLTKSQTIQNVSWFRKWFARKVLHLTREEIPHSVAVVVDSMKRDEETDKVHIRATIMVERDSQKGIIIGKGGAMLKKIGSMARRDIELMLGDKVFLETWVKVKKKLAR